MIWAKLLPHLSVNGVPLHRELAMRGTLLATDADGHGLSVQLVANPDHLAKVIRTLRIAIQSPASNDQVQKAYQRCMFSWRSIQEDSESLADLIADIALHTTDLSRIIEELDKAILNLFSDFENLPKLAVTSVAHVGPRDETEELVNLTPQKNRFVALVNRSTRFCGRLKVVSDDSALLRLGWKVPRRGHPDFAALAIAARVIGGHYHSRLTRMFRTERGWSYSPWALLRAGPHHGLWQASIRVPVQHLPKAVQGVRQLLNDYVADDVEHATAVAHATAETYRLWSSGESAVSLLGYWQDLGIDPTNEKDRWLTALSAVTTDDTVNAVHKWLTNDPHIELILT